MRKSKAELETLIRGCASDRTWVIFTEDPKMIRKLTKLHGSGRQVSECGWEWRGIAFSCVSLRKPRLAAQGTKVAP